MSDSKFSLFRQVEFLFARILYFCSTCIGFYTLFSADKSLLNQEGIASERIAYTLICIVLLLFLSSYFAFNYNLSKGSTKKTDINILIASLTISILAVFGSYTS